MLKIDEFLMRRIKNSNNTLINENHHRHNNSTSNSSYFNDNSNMTYKVSQEENGNSIRNNYLTCYSNIHYQRGEISANFLLLTMKKKPTKQERLELARKIIAQGEKKDLKSLNQKNKSK